MNDKEAIEACVAQFDYMRPRAHARNAGGVLVDGVKFWDRFDVDCMQVWGHGPEVSNKYTKGTEHILYYMFLGGEKAYRGSAESREWLSFLLGKDSPYHELFPFIIERDLDFINHNGFIFRDYVDAPAKLLYNFLIASRFVNQSHTMTNGRHFRFWRELLDDGVEPCLAATIATDCAKEGRIFYEGFGYVNMYSRRGVGRFCMKQPKDYSENNLGNPVTIRQNDFKWHDVNQPAEHIWNVRGEVFYDSTFQVRTYRDKKELIEHFQLECLLQQDEIRKLDDDKGPHVFVRKEVKPKQFMPSAVGQALLRTLTENRRTTNRRSGTNTVA